MSDPIKDNPAARLRDILVRLKEGDQGRAASDAWRYALALDAAAELPDVMRGIAATAELPAEILRRLQTDADAREEPTFTQWVEPVGNALGQTWNLQARIAETTTRYDEGTITSLGSVSYVLHRAHPRFRPDDGSPDALLEQLTVLEGDVQSAEISDELRTALLEHLVQMQHMIRLYRVRGVSAFEDVVNYGFGVVVIAAKEHPEARPVLTKIGSFVEHVNSVLTLGVGALAITEGIQKVLGG